MRIFRYTLMLALFAAFTHTTSAQDYKSAVGLRLGYPLSVSYKTFISESSAIEAYVGYRGYGFFNWISLNGAYQIHKDIESVAGLQYYYGGGGGVQFWSYDFDGDNGNTSFSVSGYLGLQYTFADTPISVTADWVPTFFLGSNLGRDFNTFGAGYGALAVRYVLGR